MNSYNFQIDTQCPQCGAPVVLEETECIIKCRFCRTRNILHTHPYPCYYMVASQKTVAGRELSYVPYWRFKGLEFSLGGHKPGFRIIDHSYLAVEKNGLPISLGFRSQTQKLKFISKGTLGSFLPPAISRKNILKKISGGGKKKIHIGEILSLIFVPFYQNADIVYDALTGKAMTLSPSDLPSGRKIPSYHLEFTPGLCPNCGWDLKGETDSLVLHCGNCISSWLIHNKKLNRLKAMFYDSVQGADLLLPFWRLKIAFKTWDFSTLAHLMKIANVPKVITNEHEKQSLYFYIPAFKINPKLFLRVGRQATLAQIEPTRIRKVPDPPLHPVDLPLEEGLQAVLPVLMDLCVHKNEAWNILAKEKLKLTSFSLMVIPFQSAGNDFVQENHGISLPKNSLKLGRHL